MTETVGRGRGIIGVKVERLSIDSGRKEVWKCVAVTGSICSRQG